MNYKIAHLAFAILVGTSISAKAQTMQLLSGDTASTLTVNIVNLSNNTGVVRIALFNSATAFQASKNAASTAIATAALPISNNTAKWAIKIPYGTYAIKAFHDENNSGTLPRDLLGIPQADYGFSNMSAFSWDRPTFNHAAFNFNATNTNITIRMKQP